MKRLIFAILLSFLLITRVNASVFTYNKTTEIQNNIEEIIEIEDNYFTIDNNSIIKYDKDFQVSAKKTFENDRNLHIESYKNNILLISNYNNFIKIYLLDNNLRIQNMKETTILYAQPNIYIDENIYMVLGKDYILEDTNMYEIFPDLTVQEQSISSYGSEKITNLLKSDYFAFNNENIKETILDTTYNNTYNVLLGKENNYFIRILDKEGNLKENIIVDEPYNHIFILNEKIIATSNNEIVIYNFDTTLEETIPVFNNRVVKLNDQIMVINNDEKNITSYLFNVYIETIKSEFGTIEVQNNALPNTKVELKVTPNSGYKLAELVITDEYGNIIPYKEDSFITPSSNVQLVANYKETVTNPETVDIVIKIIGISIIALLVITKLHKKLKWINS